MRSPHGFVASPSDGKLYKNMRKAGNTEFAISTSMEDAKTVNREALISAVPSRYTGPIKDGATAIVHHNVFRKFYASNGGKETFSTDMFDENTYLIAPNAIYAYKNSNNDPWKTVNKWCFVRPTGEMLHGEIVISNEMLEKNGVIEGDEVIFIPDSEYEFTIDEEVLYRINSEDICLVKKRQQGTFE